MGYVISSVGSRLKIRAILATDIGGNIGYGDQLIFDNPDDLKFFKEKTLHHICVMGRKTFESIGRILPDRLTVIITSHPEEMLDTVLNMKRGSTTPVPLVTSNPIRDLPQIADQYKDPTIWICGGASIYKMFARYISNWIVTRYNVNVEEWAQKEKITRWGEEYQLLPQDFDPDKLIRVKPTIYSKLYCTTLQRGNFDTGHGIIPYSIRSYQNTRDCKAQTDEPVSIYEMEERVREEIRMDNSGINADKLRHNGSAIES